MTKHTELSNLEKAVLNASNFVKEEFDLELQKSKLKQYTPKQWDEFCEVNSFDNRADGLYIPKSFTAYTKKETAFNTSDAFHELFGHGLFCEYSKIGQELVSLEQEGGNSKKYLFDINNTKQIGLTKQNIDDYEGFADRKSTRLNSSH